VDVCLRRLGSFCQSNATSPSKVASFHEAPEKAGLGEVSFAIRLHLYVTKSFYFALGRWIQSHKKEAGDHRIQAVWISFARFFSEVLAVAKKLR